MATQDVTSDFIAFRASLRSALRGGKPYSDHRPILDLETGSGGGPSTRPQPVPDGPSGLAPAPEWVDVLDQVKGLEATIRARLARLKELHVSRLKPMLGKDRVA